MQTLLVIGAGYILTLAFLVLVCFVGDAESPSYLGRTTRFFTLELPAALAACVSVLPGGVRAVQCCRGTYEYVCEKPNPLLQLVYLSLVLGGLLVFQLHGVPHIPNQYLPWWHLWTSHLAVAATLWAFLRASKTSPGVVSARTHAVYDHFPYDGFLYVKRDCTTCGVRKVARSKHCAICGHCVAKMDHHCPWINTCVGEGNYKDFLVFLGATMALLLYAAWALGYILLDFVVERQLLERVFINRHTGERMQATYMIVATFVFAEKGLLVMLFVLCAVMGVVVAAFLGYHLSLVARGTTTNESSKWGSIKSYYKDRDREFKLDPTQFPPAPSEEEVREMLNPDSAAPLEKRDLAHFPPKAPPNLYNRGVLANFREVFFPPSAARRHLLGTPTAPTPPQQIYAQQQEQLQRAKGKTTGKTAEPAEAAERSKGPDGSPEARSSTGVQPTAAGKSKKAKKKG